MITPGNRTAADIVAEATEGTADTLIPGDYLLTLRELRYRSPLEPEMCTERPHRHDNHHVVFFAMRGTAQVDVTGSRHPSPSVRASSCPPGWSTPRTRPRRAR